MNETVTSPDAAIQEALALQRQGKRELAMQRYVAILERDPKNLDALFYVAAIALHEGQLAEGIQVIQRALQVGPPQGRMHNLMGQAYLRANRDADAVECFRRAIACEPTFADAYGNLANVLADMGRREEAVAAFDQALTVRPDNPEDLCNRGSVLADLGRYDAALADYERAVTVMPDLVPAHFNKADILLRFGRYGDALASYDRAIALNPDMSIAHSNRSIVLKSMGRFAEARAAADRALQLRPDFAEAMVNRGNVAFELGQLDEAQADYRRAMEADPEFPLAKYASGLASLHQGDWAAGFPLYEYREHIPAAPFTAPPYPRWTGDPLNGERLVLLSEQGLGDTILFSRFAPLLAARGIDVTLVAPQGMHPLLSTLHGVALAAEPPAPNGRPMRWLPLMSAPGVLGIKPDSVPAEVPYLAADPGRIEQWKHALGSEGFKIGINWSTGPVSTWFYAQRSMPLAAFAPLAALPGVRLISLQHGAPAAQIDSAPFRDKIERLDLDIDPAGPRFLDSAAVLTQLDLVVSCDTAIVHLAGALARPAFTALSLVTDWRWLRERDDSPWYPTMRLVRQSRPGEWNDVFERIAVAVREMMSR